MCLIIIAVMILGATLTPSAYDLSDKSPLYYTDHSGIYRIDHRGGKATITRITDVVQKVDIDLPNTIDAVCVSTGRAIFLCNDTVNNQLLVYLYTIENDRFDSFAIYGSRLYNDTDYCCDKDYLYIENPNDNKELRKYSLSGNLINRYSFDSRITSAVSSYTDGVYITSQNSLYSIDDSRFTALNSDIEYPLFCPAEGYLITAYGSVYAVGNSAEYLFDVESDNKTRAACVKNGVLYIQYKSTIFGYDLKTGEKLYRYNSNTTPEALYTSSSDIIAVDSYGGSVCIKNKDFIDLRSKETLPVIATERPSGSGTNNNSTNNNTTKNNSSRNNADSSRNNADSSKAAQNTNDNKHISSSVYDISFDDHIISGIPSGTTVARFKENIEYNGYSVKITRDGAEKKSGNTGTAMKAVFTSSNETLTFELSVIGDITGEGNVNSRDLKKLMSFLTYAEDLSGAFYIAADLSGEGHVDVKDLAMMKRKV